MMPTGRAIPRRSSTRRRGSRGYSTGTPRCCLTSDRREPLDGVGNQRPLERLIKVRGGGVAFPVMKDELLLRLLPTLECHIQPLDLLQDRRVLLPIVLEVHRPFRRREV